MSMSKRAVKLPGSPVIHARWFIGLHSSYTGDTWCGLNGWYNHSLGSNEPIDCMMCLAKLAEAGIEFNE